MTLTLNPLDLLSYRRWIRLMLGLTWSPCAMREADALYRQNAAAILRIARLISSAVLPHVWPAPSRTLYRGLRLEDPHLDGRPLPPHPAYDGLPTLSFSESADVAAYFADSGPLGMPVIPIPNTVTGLPGLPDNGYVGTAVIGAEDVLFHWRYADALPWLFIGVRPEDMQVLRSQQEVTVRNRPDLSLDLQAFTRAAGHYIALRYPEGRWIPPASLAAP